MELEFDKEIDAILRKARSGSRVSVMTANAVHLDADTIAAFAENALPDKAKLLFMEHFADCDRCRRLLSESIFLNSEADPTAASSVSAAIAESAIPWYEILFKTQNLALAMGAIVLAFSGVLGYLVLQNRNAETNSSVSQVTEQEPNLGGPYFGGDVGAANSNALANASNTSAPAANTTAANAAAMPGSPPNSASNSLAKDTAPGGVATGGDNKGFVLDGTTADSVKTSSDKPPPPPVAAAKPAEERDESKAEAEKLKDKEDVSLAGRRSDMDDARARAATPQAKKAGGPYRSSGPVQNQSNQINSNVSDMTVIRAVGGKKFQNRNGGWYDTAYRGQATTNVRRGTDTYKKLDSGLRSIAENLGGTVVVVWKDKAYRIQ